MKKEETSQMLFNQIKKIHVCTGPLEDVQFSSEKIHNFINDQGK